MTGPIPSDDRRHDRWIALAVFLFSLLVYNANLRCVGTGDSFGTRLLPFSIWKGGTVTFEPILETAAMRNPDPYWIQPGVDGEHVSLYPVVTPVLLTPLYAPAAWYLSLHDWNSADLERMGEIMEKACASLITALTVTIFFVLLRRRISVGHALLLTAVLAFGTNTWATSSQALWLHTMTEFFAVVALWAVTGEPTKTNVIIAGVALALLVGNRPQDVFMALGIAAYGLYWARRRLGYFIAAGLIPSLLVLWYNLAYFAHPVGGYGAALGLSGVLMQWRPIPGMLGLLFSPGRGLFAFSPVLLFLPLFFMRVFRDQNTRLLSICVTAGVLLQIYLYGKTDWRAGYVYGARFMVDVAPYMVWLLAPIVTSLRRPGRIVFGVLLAISIVIQYIGVFHYTGTSNQVLWLNEGLLGTDNFWRPRNAQFLLDARSPRVPGSLPLIVRSLGTGLPPEMIEPPTPEPVKPLVRCRAIDTRIGLGGPAMRSRVAQPFPIAGNCGVPADAKSVTGFVAAVNATGEGVMHIGTNTSKLHPILHMRGPDAVATRISLALGSQGQIIAFAAMGKSGYVHLVFEVDGYGGDFPAPPLPPSACRVRWRNNGVPPLVMANSKVLMSVTATNLGDRTWPDTVLGDPHKRDGSNSVRVSYEWYPAGADRSQKKGLRWNLPHPVHAGESVTLVDDVATPAAPGEYVLVFELLQENVAWFDAYGGEKLVIPVSVR